MDEQQGPPAKHRGLCPGHWQPGWERAWGTCAHVDTCIYTAEFLCCSPGTVATLLINCAPIQNFKFLKKKICTVEVRKYLSKMAVSHIKKQKRFPQTFFISLHPLFVFPAVTQLWCVMAGWPLFCGAEPCCDLGKVTPVLWLLSHAGLEALPSGAWWAVADLP